MVSFQNTNSNLLVNPLSCAVEAETVFFFFKLILNCHLTIYVPDKVEDTGFQKSLWIFIYCCMKLNAIDHLKLSPLKTQNQTWI